MKYSTIFLLTTLSVLVLSYGMSSLAYGQGNVAPINVKTDHAAYGTGEIITIFGFVKDYDGSNDVVIQVFAPNGNLASVAQISPDSVGNYSTELTAAGMISLEGEYIVKVQIINNGPQRNQTVFEFVGGEDAPAPAAPEESVTTTEPEPDMEPEPVMQATEPICGKGTVLKDGLCVVEQEKKGGGCLIATAAFGSELAPQVQFLREIRDNTVLQTESGTSFMTGFNQFYYSFSPAIADYERENPAFKETVKLALTPMLTSLTILNYVDIDSEEEMLGYGIGIILLNIGMYFVAPAVIIMKIKNRK
jgi:hypothetical protein